ncbi:hypothetical protein Q5H93_22520 [Hymenobacter sp. ASUV-10]|uniref:YHYH domain-containing protein n=1 Tax=Hymenobacter aranciens TaxID=3063996 RepID=A0ABT9BH12_9BACT|nr:hypothetical protein [Hymenobacter sp. ASUV-10]MDO7877531.1 hypothetical protein [Hymenobacter sp. ASUV-10]
MLKTLLSLRLSALLLLLPLAWFAWATYTNTRILGDDNESTEELNGPAGNSHARGYHGHSYHSSGYYHK